MACLYCGGDVPLRMRLTGEERFCCPEHKRLYNEEHTRIGLARLLEEAGTNPGAGQESAETLGAIAESDEAAPQPDGNALPEPVLVSSGGGLRLWLFPHLAHRPAPRFEEFLAPGPEPVAFAPPVQELTPPQAEQPQPNEKAAVSAVAEPPAAPPAVKPAPPVKPSSPERTRGDEQPREAAKTHGKPPAEPHSAAAAAPENKPGKPKQEEQEPDQLPVPAFEGYEAGKGGSWLRVAAALVLALGAAGGGYYWYNTSAAPASSPRATQAQSQLWEDWIPRWARTAGGEEIALFGPSLGWTDYRVQWRANPDEEVAWVYRAADPRNYYVLRLELTRYGTWKVVRYALIDGRRTQPEERILSQQLPEQRRVAVQLEVRGSEFRLYVDGHNVASWQDERLKRGGFGVMRPDAGLAGLGNVTVTELGGNSVQEGRLWRKLHRERLPEVTLLGQTREPRLPPQSSAEESEL